MTIRAAPAWTPIMLTWWATTSCSSRAIRTRSSKTARRALASRSRSAWIARSCAASAWRARSRIAMPANHATAMRPGTKTKLPAGWSGALATTIAAALTAIARPIRAWTAPLTVPTSSAAARPAR